MPLVPLPAAGHKRIPWKNGLGISQTIAGMPQDAGFDTVIWQVSSTGIDSDCPFSALTGLDRRFMVIEGKGVELTCVDEDGRTHAGRVTALQSFEFRGDWKTACRLLDGPVRVLNVMTRCGRATASVEFLEDGGFRQAAGETAVVADLKSLDAWIATGAQEEAWPLPAASGPRVLVRIRT